MEYQALYRKYRPQTFDEVIGQDHVTRTLAQEVIEEKVAHAYLFAGPRGTGKTTSARLLAKALNCTDLGSDGEPCTTCVSCIGIAEGTSLDVIELDAASHNKVEDVREIRVNVGTVAVASGAKRVYILDEAHMLSRAAGNALLKTLEEPPEHVVFVLATTEPYKLLDTIRSRSQRFDFHPVPVEVLTEYLRHISTREGFETESDALKVIAGHARGSVRDALSLLEQVAALGRGSVEVESVVHALGLADKDAFGKLAVAIKDQDAPAALGLVAELSSQGADLRRFVAESIGFFRGVFLAQYAPNLEQVADEPLDTLDEWRRYAAVLPAGDVLRAVDGLSEALLELRQGREERLVVELALLRLTRPETAHDTAALDVRLGRLETRVRELHQQVATPSAATVPNTTTALAEASAVPARQASSGPVPAVAASDEEHAVATPGEETGSFAVAEMPVTPELAPVPMATEPAVSEVPLLEDLDIDTFDTAWPAIVARIREDSGPRRHALIKEVTPAGVVKGVVTLEVPAHLPFHLEQLREDDELHDVVKAVAAEVLGGGIDLVFVPASGEDKPDPVAERAPDKDHLLSPQAGDGNDPEELVVDLLGGEVVTE